MGLKSIYFLIGLMFFFKFSFAQNLTEERFEKIISELKSEAVDSIEKLSIECEIKREKILSLIKEKGFDERFIVGPNRKYLNEGMSSHFVKVPKPMSPIYPNRDKKVTLLENTHIALFHLDLKLNIAKHIKSKLDSIDYKEFTQDIWFLIGDSISDISLKKYIAFFIVKTATKDIEFSKISKKNIEEEIQIESFCEADENDDFIHKKPYIIASFPYDGQYNVHIDEKRKNVDFGFIKPGGDYYSKVFNYDSVLVAVYTNTKGDIKVVDAIFISFYDIIEFELPHNFLKRGELFKLQLALRPILKANSYGDVSIDELVKRNYYNLFKVLDIDTEIRELKDISNIFDPIYFRTSIYPGKTEKIENAKITVGKDPFKIKIKLDEPFDEFEIKGTKCNNPVIGISAFQYYSYWDKMQKKYSKRLAYYLTVPVIEHVNIYNIAKDYTALLDNTLKDNNIIKANKTFAENYIKNVNEFFGISLNTYDAVRAEFKQNKKMKKITEKDFKRGKVKKVRHPVLTAYLSNYGKMNEGYFNILKKLKSRKKKRAKFFYKLHIVDSKRKNTKPKYNLRYFLDREEEIIKSIMGANYKDFKPVSLLNSQEKLNFESVIPFTNRKDYNISLKIDYSKFK